MKEVQYEEFDDDVDWAFTAFMAVVAEALKNDVDMGIIARTAQSIAATAAKRNLSEKMDEIEEKR